jgi:hypothetical protein
MLIKGFRDASLTISLLAAAGGLLAGLGLHFLAVYLRDYGPEWPGISFRGNGALIVLPLAAVLLLAGVIYCVSRRVCLGVVLLPLTLFLGMFVIAGSF